MQSGLAGEGQALQPRSLVPGLVLISAASLAFQIALTRLFAFQQFHHFAFLVVSLAVMGSAASGILLAARRHSPPLPILSLGFSLSLLAAYAVLRELPFDSYTLAWDPRQAVILFLYFLASGLPFLFTGWIVAACLSAAGPVAHLPYGANLAGSACGAAGALLALRVLSPEGLLGLLVAMGLAAAAAFSPAGWRAAAAALFASAVAAFSFRLPASWSVPLSPYKPLAMALLMPDAHLTLTRSAASARLDVVESRAFHVLPGLSLNAPADLPDQAAVFLDGEGPLPITSLAPEDARTAALMLHMPTSLAYLLRPESDALILEPGAGLEPLIALASGAHQVALPTDEPLIVDLLSGPYATFSHNLLDHPAISRLPLSSRSALHLPVGTYDIVDFALSDGYHPVTSGAFSLLEDYLLTVDAVRQAYRRLNDDGLLVITRWLQTPPSEETRAFATLLEALALEGIKDPAARVIGFRSLRTATIIACRRPFTAQELSTVRRFLQANGFDPIVLPDLSPSELNRHNRLPEDRYHELFTALIDNRAGTLARHPFNLHPPTDDRPYFFHFFRIGQTPEVLRTLGQTWQPFGGSGYLVLLALLAVMVILAMPLIALPVVLLRRRQAARPRGGPLIYFASLGAAYLMVEIPLLQRMTLLLERPSHSLGIVLFTLLLASGVGSLLSARLPLRPCLLALVAILLATRWLLSPAISAALTWPLPARIFLAVLLMSPAGLLMGVPFATGLRRLEARAPGLIPWAWAVNGATSGVSGVLAALIALDAGQSTTLLAAALAYAIAWLASSAFDRP